MNEVILDVNEVILDVNEVILDVNEVILKQISFKGYLSPCSVELC